MIFILKNIDGNYSQSMRAARKQLLADSDWTQLSDAQCDKGTWAAYRQALRDFPATWEPSEIADFPARPDAPVVEETPVVDEPSEGEQP